MPGGHQIERLIRKRQWFAIAGLDDLHAARAQQFTCALGIRSPRFGDGHVRREGRRFSNDLPATGVDVEGGFCTAQPFGEEPGEPPRRPFFGRAPVEPMEAPPVDIGRCGFAHQLIE